MPHLPDHQTDHDPLLIAAFAAGDAEGPDLERAQSLVATCDDCAALHHDLRAIASAMPALPAPARSRDFRLTRDQADELRPSGWRRLLAPLAGPRFAFAAPLGGSLAALGLAGILVAGAASTPIAGTGSGGGAGATASAMRDQGSAGGPGTSGAEVELSAASAGPGGPLLAAGAPQPSAPPFEPGAVVAAASGASPSSPRAATASAAAGSANPGTIVDVPEPSADAAVDNGYGIDAGSKATVGSGTTRTAAETLASLPSPSSPSPLLGGAVVLLLVGGALAGARWLARRAA